MLEALSSQGRQPAGMHSLSLLQEHHIPLGKFPDLPKEAPPLPPGNYGITPQSHPELEPQLAAFEASQTGGACLARISRTAGSQSVYSVMSLLRCYLGYIALALKQPLTLGLALCLQPSYIASYCKARMQAGHSWATLHHTLEYLRKAIRWAASLAPALHAVHVQACASAAAAVCASACQQQQQPCHAMPCHVMP